MTVLGAIRIALVRLKIGDGESTILPKRARRRRGGRVAMLWFVAALLALNGAALLVLSDARVRDPEYGRRMAHLRDRLAENPGRPLVVVVGSSRAAMGIRPAEWEAVRPADPARPDPLLFNLSIIGSGPVMELMTLRRVFADGLRPDVVLLEFWPPFLHHDHGWAEPNRVAVDRLRECDRELVRDYFPEAERIEREMRWRRTSPIFANRERLLSHVIPWWVPPEKRVDWSWDDVDPWGWKPGSPLPPKLGPERTAALARNADTYRPLFAAYRVSPDADRAFREAVMLARQHGAAVGFIGLPESSEFRGLYPGEVEQMTQLHLDSLSIELNVPAMNCREWMDDRYIVDGLHLSQIGAAEFTRKFGPAVVAVLPTLRNARREGVQP